MVEHFPGKTIKQIRDKRKEASYRKLLQTHLDEPTEAINPRLNTGGGNEDLSAVDNITISGRNPPT